MILGSLCVLLAPWGRLGASRAHLYIEALIGSLFVFVLGPSFGRHGGGPGTLHQFAQGLRVQKAPGKRQFGKGPRRASVCKGVPASITLQRGPGKLQLAKERRQASLCEGGPANITFQEGPGTHQFAKGSPDARTRKGVPASIKFQSRPGKHQ